MTPGRPLCSTRLWKSSPILADSAKYDVACTSSGASRRAAPGTLGSCYAPGCCHAFTADGRCVSLLKVLLTNRCAFDCSYCVNRRSNDVPRASFEPRELAELTIEFYRRNYIEGLFLSSAVLGTPDYTTERMLEVLRLLRGEYRFGGYIHAKTIPGASPELVQQMGYLADRLSVNIELPSEQSLRLLAPDKGRRAILRPMKQIAVSGQANREELALYRRAPRFAPAGQSTQMIVGASPESDYQYPAADRRAVPELPAQTGILLCLHPGIRRCTPAGFGHKAPAAAGAPAVPGRLAAAVLSLPGRGAAGPGAPQLRPLPGPQVQLGCAALRAVPHRHQPRPL